mgnify:CR=1 FL=1
MADGDGHARGVIDPPGFRSTGVALARKTQQVAPVAAELHAEAGGEATELIEHHAAPGFGEHGLRRDPAHGDLRMQDEALPADLDVVLPLQSDQTAALGDVAVRSDVIGVQPDFERHVGGS